jgi:hypothetical protein
MDNEDNEVQALALAPIVIPPCVIVPNMYVGYHDNFFNLAMMEQYQSLLDMGFTPVDETGDMTPTATYVEPMFVMDRRTILYEFEQLQKGVGNQVIQEFLNQNGQVVLISKYHEIYVFQPQLNMVQNG